MQPARAVALSEPHLPVIPRQLGGRGDRLEQLARAVLSALSSLLASIPGGPARPQDLARSLSLNKDLTSRLLMALREGDPISGIQSLPGSVPLRTFLAATRAAGADTALAARADEAIREWDRFVHAEFGDRKSMQAALSDLVPTARRRQESSAKQAVYRGMADIKGLCAESSVVAFLLHPSREDREQCDTLMIGGSTGIRRLRTTAIIQYTSVLRAAPLGRQPVAVGQDGEFGPVLREFCSPPDLPIVTEVEGGKVHYTLAMEGTGTRTNADFFLSEFYPRNHPRWTTEADKRTRWSYATVEVPSKHLVFDMYLHRDVWADVEPRVMVFDTAVNGVANPNDPSRHRDLLNLNIATSHIPAGPGRHWCPGVPKFAKMLQQAAGHYGWNLEEFRGHRCEISYPVYGSQVCMNFQPPRKP